MSHIEAISLLEASKQALEALKGYRRELNDHQPCDAEKLLEQVIARAESTLEAEQEQGEPTNVYDDPCPDCGKQLQVVQVGGVKCSCGYWFCF